MHGVQGIVVVATLFPALVSPRREGLPGDEGDDFAGVSLLFAGVVLGVFE